MYIYQRAIAKEKAKDSHWTNVDISNLTLRSIFETYQKIYAVLKNDFFGEQEIVFDLETIRITHSQSNLTFVEFLTSVGNKALQHMESLPTISTRYLKYRDAFHAGYKIKAVHPTAHPDAVLRKDQTPWAFLTRDNTDYKMLYENCLFTVNGFFHMTDYSSSGLYVVDAMKSAKIANQNTIGIYSFRELGKIEIIPIKEEMVQRQHPDIPLKTRIYLDIGKDIGKKVPGIVIGGYLHFFDEKIYHMVSERVMCIEFLNYRFLDRFYESGRFIDLSTLPVERGRLNDTQILLDSLFSDDCIKAYFQLPQSFVVLLDAEDLFTEHVGLEAPNMPGMFVTGIKPELPLVGGYGRMLDYWFTYEDRKYSITCSDDRIDMRQYNTTNWFQLLSVADHRLPEEPVKKGNAFFWRFGTDLKTA